MSTDIPIATIAERIRISTQFHAATVAWRTMQGSTWWSNGAW